MQVNVEAGSSSRRVLVVDDNADSADMMQMALELRGHVVATAYDARSALDMVEQFRPEVVLLDIGLPDLDGYELAERLGQHPNACNAKLVAVTGWGEMDRERAGAYGFSAHLVKPVAASDVLELVATAPRHDGEPEG
jgi:two-component system, sensor histidine kinase